MKMLTITTKINGFSIQNVFPSVFQIYKINVHIKEKLNTIFVINIKCPYWNMLGSAGNVQFYKILRLGQFERVDLIGFYTIIKTRITFKKKTFIVKIYQRRC